MGPLRLRTSPPTVLLAGSREARAQSHAQPPPNHAIPLARACTAPAVRSLASMPRVCAPGAGIPSRARLAAARAARTHTWLGSTLANDSELKDILGGKCAFSFEDLNSCQHAHKNGFFFL